MEEKLYKIKNTPVTENELYYYFLTLHFMGHADKKFLPSEQKYFIQKLNSYQHVSKKIMKFMEPYVKDLELAKHKISSFFLANNNDEYKKAVMVSLREMALIDNELHASEKEFLSYIRKISAIDVGKMPLIELDEITQTELQNKLLIAEIFSDAKEEKILKNVINTYKSGQKTFLQLFEETPFLMIRVIAWVGQKHYSQSENVNFYDHLKQTLQLNEANLDFNEISNQFVKVINQHDSLLRFDRTGQQETNVKRIILHAGIPTAHLNSYFESLYQGFTENKFSFIEMLASKVLDKTILSYFTRAQEFAFRFYTYSLKLFLYEDLTPLNIPLNVMRQFLMWKTNFREHYFFIKERIPYCQSEKFHFLLTPNGELALYFADVAVLRDDQSFVTIRFSQLPNYERKATVYPKRFIKANFSRQILNEQIIVLTTEETEYVLKNLELKITDTFGFPLGYLNLFKSNYYKVAVFEQSRKSFLIHKKSHSPSAASSVVVPQNYLVKVKQNKSITVISRNLIKIIHLEKPEDIQDISLLSEEGIEVKIAAKPPFRLKRVPKPIPYLFYKTGRVFAGATTDLSLNFSIASLFYIEKIDKLKKQKLQNISGWGKYLIDEDEQILCIPPLDINLVPAKKELVLKSHDENISFVNHGQFISYKYEEDDTEIFFQVFINEVSHTLVYELPHIKWGVSTSLEQPKVNNKKQLIFDDQFNEDMYIFIKTHNIAGKLEGTVGGVPVIIRPHQAGIYYIDLKELKNLVIKSPKAEQELQVKINDYIIKIAKFRKRWLLSEQKAGMNSRMIKLLWTEKQNLEGIRKLRIWDYYAPYKYPQELDITDVKTIAFKNPGYAKILIEWIIEAPRKKSFNPADQPVMPLYVMPLDQILPEEVENRFFEDTYLGVYTRNGRLLPEHKTLLAPSNIHNLYNNYFIFDNAEFFPEASREADYESLLSNVSVQTIDTIIRLLQFFHFNHLYKWLERAYELLATREMDLFVYDELKLIFPDNYFIKIFDEYVLKENGFRSYFNRICSLSDINNVLIPVNIKASLFNKYYIDQFHHSIYAMDYLLSRTQRLFECGIYGSVMNYFLTQYFHVLKEDSIWRVQLTLNLKDIVIENAKDLTLFLEQLIILNEYVKNDVYPLAFLDNLVFSKIELANIVIDEVNTEDMAQFIISNEQSIEYLAASLRRTRSSNLEIEITLQQFARKLEYLTIKNEEKAFFSILEGLGKTRLIDELKKLMITFEVTELDILQKIIIISILADRHLLGFNSKFLDFFSCTHPMLDLFIDLLTVKDNQNNFLQSSSIFMQSYFQELAVLVEDAFTRYEFKLKECKLLSDFAILRYKDFHSSYVKEPQ